MWRPIRPLWISRRIMQGAAWFLATALATVVVWLTMTWPIPVKTVHPQRGELVVEVFGTGTLESKIMVGVSSKIVGKVVEVLADQGDTVSVGQTLARLEAKDFQDAVGVAEAQRDQVAATLAKAKLDLERQRSLLSKNLIAYADFETYETGYRVVEAQLKTAQASLRVARAKLADTEVVCTASGIVATRNLEVGSTVVPGAPIFRIAASTPWVVAQVDERATGDLRLGQPARVVFETNAAQPETGHIARLSTEVDRVTEEREVDIALDRVPNNAFLGQRADAYLETSRKRDVLRAPLSAVVIREGQTGVFAVVDHRAVWRPLQLGMRGRELAEVVSGMSEQDFIILNPFSGKTPINNGARVSVISDDVRP